MSVFISQTSGEGAWECAARPSILAEDVAIIALNANAVIGTFLTLNFLLDADWLVA
jgi:hypothetical protein